MKRSSRVVLFVILLTPSVFANTLYVGTCHTPSYSTISAAVAAATAGATIDVCPGTYPEQVFVTKQLTIQGITSSGGDLARIVVPASIPGGPTNWQFVTDPYAGGEVAPQVSVNSPSGTVKIINLTIDGSGEIGASPCGNPGSWETTGIYAWSSVNVNELTTTGQGQNNGCGTGIWAEDLNGIDSVTISHSLVLGASQAATGIYLDAQSSGSSMTVSVTHNTIQTPQFLSFGLWDVGVSGEILSNTIAIGYTGINDSSSSGPLTISENTMIGIGAGVGNGIGIAGSGSASNIGPETYSNNSFVSLGTGIVSPNSGSVTMKGNAFVNDVSAIQLQTCTGWTLSGNTINNATYAFPLVPSGFTPTASQVSFYNVGQFIATTFSCP